MSIRARPGPRRRDEDPEQVAARTVKHRGGLVASDDFVNTITILTVMGKNAQTATPFAKGCLVL